MGQQYNQLSEQHIEFIAEQRIFFVGTATADSRVSVSPKGMDSLLVLDPGRVVWLNVTGSGNETAAHVQQHPRMTIMFCAFDGDPLIMRLYGTAKVIHNGDPEWAELFPLFKPLPGALGTVRCDPSRSWRKRPAGWQCPAIRRLKIGNC